ncbi:MAG: T9SS type A sorting domain-containing protein [Flavobacteriales bacterium]|nr:T9SS type A sorting domain-containing protein [Flavobacteriales bacterium]
MKKSYLLALGFLTVATTVIGQQKLLTVPNHVGLEQKELIQSSSETPDSEAKMYRSIIQALPNRGGVPTLWQEDFGGGFPNGWAVDDVSGINPWKWSMDGSHGNFNSVNGAGYDDPINSTTAGNGFLINDPDSANHFTYGQPSGTTYQYLESYFATTEIDLGASYPSLLLEFEQSFRFNNGVDMVVQVSTDSTNWTDYTVQGNTANNAASADPALVSINISGTVGTSQTLFLRIGWSARVYFWMIDDMRIVEGLGNDLAMTDVWHGDFIGDWEYQQIPLAQSQEIVIGAACLNQGGTAQTNAIYSYDISNGGTSLASGTFPAETNSIGSTGRDTTWYATGFTPSDLGDYTVTVSVEADATDELMSNNEGESLFKMTNNIYAHDDEDNVEFQVSGGDNASGVANEYKIALYYSTVASGTLTAVQVAFAANTTTESCIVEVFDAINDQSLSNPIVTEVYDLVSGDISAGAVPTFVNILIDGGDGVQLDADGLYLISIGNTGEGEDLWFLASDGDEDRAQLRFGPFGVGNAIDWYTGYTTSPMIRANFDPSVDVSEAALAEKGFGIYPNPTTDNFTLVLDKNSNVQSVSLLSLEGKLIMDLTNMITAGNQKVEIGTANLAPGVYLVSVISADGIGTQKIVVQ